MLNQFRIAIAGLILLSKAHDIRSLGVTGEGKILDGGVVAINDDGETCRKVTAGDTDFGVVMFHHIGKSGRTDDGEAECYIEGDVAPVMIEGRIWVEPSETITERGKTAKVYVNTTDGTLGQTAEGNTELLGAHWDSLTNEDGLAIVNLG